MTTLLNSARVRTRRLELGLSERELSGVTGLGQAVIRGVEAGTNHKDLTLGELTRLAAALTVDVAQLLTVAEPTTTAAKETQNGEHLARVCALLHDVNRLIPVESLATTTGHTLEQTHAVLAVLDAQLRTIGLRVHTLGNTVRVCSDVDAVDAETLRRTWRAHLGRRGLDIGQVHTLHQVRAGRRSKTLTNDQQVTVNQLTNAGLLTRTTSGGAELSADVRYSLLLDEPSVSHAFEES